MKTDNLPMPSRVEDRRITRANAGRVIRNGLRAQEGYNPLPGNKTSDGDPRVNIHLERMGLDRYDGRISRLNQMDTIPNRSPNPYDPNSRIGAGTRGTVR